MTFQNQIGRQAGKFLNTCKNNNGVFLFATLAAAWALSSFAQTVGLIANKKIPKEDKKFLVPQEILDGTFNIATYAAVSLPIMYGAAKAASIKFPTNKKAVEGAKTLGAIAGGILASNIITPLLRNKLGAVIKEKINEKNPDLKVPETFYTRNYPQFKASGKPLSMQNFVNIAKTYSGNLKI